MTREDIAERIKPLDWQMDEDYSGQQIISAQLINRMVYIKHQENERVTLVLGYDNGSRIEIDKSVKNISVYAAKILAKEWQVDEMCEYFELD
jgi:hypothetical protein|nr:MAG TPA: hypothetical protein [Crassvirales sp.]